MKTHKLSNTSFYHAWMRIIQVCTNKNDKRYYLYGGRGIKNLWESFEEFKNDMYESYKESLDRVGKDNTTIDRIDNNGNYCKENCRWATRSEQARNRRTTPKVTFKGKTQTIKEWAIELKMSRSAIALRLSRYKWPVEKALTVPIGPRNRWRERMV